MSQELSAKIYRNLFTEDEWDAIFAALSDYQDYGSAQNKIRKIFELTDNNVTV
jgi:archaellum biogenesis protein FlaJ (TadC family)